MNKIRFINNVDGGRGAIYRAQKYGCPNYGRGYFGRDKSRPYDGNTKTMKHE